MEAIRQTVRIPRNHKITINVPEYFAEDELMEVILLAKKNKKRFREKISDLKEAAKDPMYLADMAEISEDFRDVDLEGWE